jgi:NhaA family Na+:H+ antiporter
MRSARAPATQSRLAPLLQPLQAFLSAESAGGIILIAATVIALAWANSPWAHAYHEFWHTPLTLRVGERVLLLSMSLAHWVNDGLMVIFFLLVGLEIKRELLIGELSSLRQAALPIAAAIGGMVVPALIYALINRGADGAARAGWAIPMATDIAFAVGVLALVGRGIAVSLKIFLLAIAIVDDLGAVLVIALFYTHDISATALLAAAGFLAALLALNLLRVHRPLPYMLLGIGLWVAMLASGIHATVAGVLLAFTIPATRQIEEDSYLAYVRAMLESFERDANQTPDRITENQSHALKAMEEASQWVQTPLARVEHALLAPVNFLIVPLFALANAGVGLGSRGGSENAPATTVLSGVLFGLAIGKPLGVLAATWIATRLRVAELPQGTTTGQLVGVSMLCGIGFTMSLFIANLAFAGGREAQLSAAKIGILAGSLFSGLVGGAILAASARRNSFAGRPSGR